ncbi:hypothetical protein BH20CHL1_BH20CHL1_00570 [soil metagenome]
MRRAVPDDRTDAAVMLTATLADLDCDCSKWSAVWDLIDEASIDSIPKRNSSTMEEG